MFFVFKQNLFSVVTNSNTLVFFEFLVSLCRMSVYQITGLRVWAAPGCGVLLMQMKKALGTDHCAAATNEMLAAVSLRSYYVVAILISKDTTFLKRTETWNHRGYSLVTLASYGISLVALFILLTWVLLGERYNITVNIILSIASSFFNVCFSKSSVWVEILLNQYEDVTLVLQKYRKFRVQYSDCRNGAFILCLLWSFCFLPFWF